MRKRTIHQKLNMVLIVGLDWAPLVLHDLVEIPRWMEPRNLLSI